jgi:hypothetical protein
MSAITLRYRCLPLALLSIFLPQQRIAVVSTFMPCVFQNCLQLFARQHSSHEAILATEENAVLFVLHVSHNVQFQNCSQVVAHSLQSLLSSSHVPSQISASKVIRSLAHSLDGSPPPWPLTLDTLVAARALLFAGTVASKQEMFEFVSAYLKREHDWPCVYSELNALLRPRRIEPPFDSNGLRTEFGVTPVEWRGQLAALELAKALAETPVARGMLRLWVQQQHAAAHIMAAAANCFYTPIKAAACACL